MLYDYWFTSNPNKTITIARSNDTASDTDERTINDPTTVQCFLMEVENAETDDDFTQVLTDYFELGV